MEYGPVVACPAAHRWVQCSLEIKKIKKLFTLITSLSNYNQI